MRLYQYPVLGGPTAALANKSFFKADRVNMQWNKKGEATPPAPVCVHASPCRTGHCHTHFL